MFWWLGFVWIRWSCKAISDMEKGHCSQCNMGQWLLVIILTAWVSSSPLSTPTLIFPHLFCIYFVLPFDHLPKLHQNGTLSVSDSICNHVPSGIFKFSQELIVFGWRNFECNSVAITACVISTLFYNNVLIMSWCLCCMLYLPIFPYCLSFHYQKTLKKASTYSILLFHWGLWYW